MPFIGMFKGSFFAGERPGIPVGLSCSIGAGQSPVYTNIVTERDITVTGATSGGNIWGSNPYTEDSNMNMAAVHAGLVSVGETATITQYDPGDYFTTPGYISSTRNGITSSGWYTRWCGLYLRRNPSNTLSGVANASNLKGYFGPAPNKAFRFTTTGVDTVNVESIAYSPYGTSGLNSIITKDYNASAFYALGTTFAGGVDDGFYTVPIYWNINFLGTIYNNIFVGTNSYVTFGGGSTQFSGLNYGTPNLPKILICSADNSVQKLWYGYTGSAPNRALIVRFEGINDLHYYDPNNILPMDSPHYPGGSYGANKGPMVWEMKFFENNPTVIELQVIENSKWV